MSLILLSTKSHHRRLPGKVMLTLGGAAITWAALRLFKTRTLVSYPEPFCMQVDAATETGEIAEDEWMDTLEKAMAKMPMKAGFDESVWTAPLLREHIRKVHGISVPVSRIRSALKGLGYHWKHTHYVQPRKQAA